MKESQLRKKDKKMKESQLRKIIREELLKEDTNFQNKIYDSPDYWKKFAAAMENVEIMSGDTFEFEQILPGKLEDFTEDEYIRHIDFIWSETSLRITHTWGEGVKEDTPWTRFYIDHILTDRGYKIGGKYKDVGKFPLSTNPAVYAKNIARELYKKFFKYTKKHG